MAIAEIKIGTCGYSYKDWVGEFYPVGMGEQEFLKYYSKFFDVCEINYTFYKMPDKKTAQAMLDKSEGKVDFVYKLHQSITHSAEDCIELTKEFISGIAPTLEAKKVDAILAQFPNSFRPDRRAWEKIRALKELVSESAPLVVEFRNADWLRARYFDRLRNLNVGFCCVDEPRGEGLLPPVAVATSDIAYIRFHGRNRFKWWKQNMPDERYDYLYTDDELKEWVAKIEALSKSASKVLIFFNNHPRGQAAKNAIELRRMLKI